MNLALKLVSTSNKEKIIIHTPSPIYVVPSINFQTFFVHAFKIDVDSWKFTMLLLWDDWLLFMISGTNELLQQQLEYTLLKPDCHSWWFSKMQSGREEEWYTIKFWFKLGKKKPQKRMEFFRLFWTILHELSISFWVAFEIQWRQEVSGDDERCGRSKEVNTPELISQRVRVSVTMLSF